MKNGNWGYLLVTALRTGNGVTFRSCFIDEKDASCPLVFVNAGATPGSSVLFENCTCVQGGNSAVYERNLTPLDNVLFKNCFFWSRYNKYLAAGCQDVATQTNCVFVQIGMGTPAGGTANLDPQYGNRVLTLDELKLKGGTTVDDSLAFDWRPTEDSPLVDACMNRFDVAWAQKCSKRRGPRDMGDGTWTEKPYRTVTVGKGTTWEKTYDAGVVWTRNNANPRRYGSVLDIGCFEFWRPSGVSLLIR